MMSWGEGHRKTFYRRSFEDRAPGDDTFIDQALLKAEGRRAADIDLGQVIASVCAAYQLNVEELCNSGKGQPAAEARAVAALLLRNSETLSLVELARFLERDLSVLSQAAHRIKRRVGTESLLCTKLEEMSDKLRISVCQAWLLSAFCSRTSLMSMLVKP